jgi:glycosyltransferase involved in cell wall biosynthesis
MSGAGAVGVAMVLETLGRGGAERILVSLANRLDAARFDVHVVAIREPGDLAAELGPHVTMHALRREKPWDVRTFRRFAGLLAANGVRIVHTHSHMAAYFVRIAGWTGYPWIHVVHDHYPLIASSRLRYADRLLLRHVDYCFTTSKQLEEYETGWVGIAPERCETLPNWIDLPAPPRAECPETFSIVHVARVVPQKDQRMAIRVAARLRESLPAFRWVLVGRAESSYARACREDIARLGLTDHVQLVGERPDAAALVAGAHVGVLTSSAEARPLALLEYMAAGLPVVVTDVGDVGGVVQEAGGGRVVASGDTDGFAVALLHYATDAEAAATDGAANRRYVTRAGGAAEAVRRVEEVYTALLREARVRRA